MRQGNEIASRSTCGDSCNQLHSLKLGGRTSSGVAVFAEMKIGIILSGGEVSIIILIIQKIVDLSQKKSRIPQHFLSVSRNSNSASRAKVAVSPRTQKRAPARDVEGWRHICGYSFARTTILCPYRSNSIDATSKIPSFRFPRTQRCTTTTNAKTILPPNHHHLTMLRGVVVCWMSMDHSTTTDATIKHDDASQHFRQCCNSHAVQDISKKNRPR